MSDTPEGDPAVPESKPTFTVDTHLFRELGELLVGRDSTALVELIKNAYDADATRVEVSGVHLESIDLGRITITDDGVGMNAEQFQRGFLRVASRFKSEGESRSLRHGRRYTGAKGIGRLAAHKLARHIAIDSTPWKSGSPEQDTRPIQATIDWDQVEALATLDEVSESKAVTLATSEPRTGGKSGTIIALTRLRRRWTDKEKARFFAEVTSFTPPAPLLSLSKHVLPDALLFKSPKVRDVALESPGFSVELRGELEAGEEFWVSLAEAADWVIEIDATRPTDEGVRIIRYGIAPTKQGREEYPDAKRSYRFDVEAPADEHGLFFQARILIREGGSGNIDQQWLGRSAGVRVFMEGFRVLPYGEIGNDWLSLDYDYSRRVKQSKYLSGVPIDLAEAKDEGLVSLRSTSYFGAVFLTLEGTPGLRMLVNREGFVPDAQYDELVQVLRTAIDLSTRVRAQTRVAKSQERREARQENSREVARQELRVQVEAAVARAGDFSTKAIHSAQAGNVEQAVAFIRQAAGEFDLASHTSDRLLTEGSILRILASVGAQMSAFVHEINGLLGTASAVEAAFEDISGDQSLDPAMQRRLARIRQSLGDLRRSIERQASYLVDVISPDARRRRSRQKIAERFEAARRLVDPAIERRGIEVVNDIAPSLRSPAMFPAEITIVFSNLLTNAVKAAGEQGRIRAWTPGDKSDKTGVRLRIENTGQAVSPDEGERWFLPFESTTTEVDPVLGQGMGMGLPITRNVLAEYGAIIRFVAPSAGYATALEIVFPP